MMRAGSGLCAGQESVLTAVPEGGSARALTATIGPWTRGKAGSGRSGTVFEFPICSGVAGLRLACKSPGCPNWPASMVVPRIVRSRDAPRAWVAHEEELFVIRLAKVQRGGSWFGYEEKRDGGPLWLLARPRSCPVWVLGKHGGDVSSHQRSRPSGMGGCRHDHESEHSRWCVPSRGLSECEAVPA